MNMRRFIILCLLLFASLAAQARSYRAEDIPNVQRADRTRYVSNPDGILAPAEEPAPPEPSNEEKLLTEIRDLLKEQK